MWEESLARTTTFSSTQITYKNTHKTTTGQSTCEPQLRPTIASTVNFVATILNYCPNDDGRCKLK